MKSTAINSLVICMYMLSNNQLQSMDDKATQEQVKLNHIWSQARLGTIDEKEIKRFLQANVLAIGYSEKSQEKKIDLLNNLFTQAFCAGTIKDPFEKQFHGITFTGNNNEPHGIIISYHLQFGSIMEFATIAGNNFVLEQAVKTAITLKNTPHFQEKMNLAAVRGLDHSKIHSTEIFEIFKKYDVSFNIALDNGKTLLHRHAIFPNSIIWLLKNTDIDGNKQDDKGNTVAHHFARSGTSDRLLLVKVFNAFIAKNINPLIKNNEEKTAKDIALDTYYRYDKIRYACCANLFNKLEEVFSRTELCFSWGKKLVLKNDGDTIELTDKKR